MNINFANATPEAALGSLRERYAQMNPASAAGHLDALKVMPGGNTRSVLHFEPFPLTMVRGQGAMLWDADGHDYIDCVGEFSAGLYGHSEPVILDAIRTALEGGIVMASPTPYERELATALAARFPSVEKLRFCNSGTEAGMFAVLTARIVTGRPQVMAFREAYHGGVIKFDANDRLNLPIDWVLADYNDVDQTRAMIHRHRDTLAAILVEPVLGAVGNIRGSAEFLRMLSAEAKAVGALLIFDEVKTSRLGPGGVQGELGITPDMTTFGKYLGGGLSCGVFGGRADIMDWFDPFRSDGLAHAGTFNNNVCSMAAGVAGLKHVFTAERARKFLADTEAFRVELDEAFRSNDLPMTASGWGSLISIHFSTEPVTTPKQIHPARKRLAKLLHMHCLLDGVLMATRGDMAFSLAAEKKHLSKVKETIVSFGEHYAPLLRRTLIS